MLNVVKKSLTCSTIICTDDINTSKNCYNVVYDIAITSLPSFKDVCCVAFWEHNFRCVYTHLKIRLYCFQHSWRKEDFPCYCTFTIFQVIVDYTIWAGNVTPPRCSKHFKYIQKCKSYCTVLKSVGPLLLQFCYKTTFFLLGWSEYYGQPYEWKRHIFSNLCQRECYKGNFLKCCSLLGALKSNNL